MEESNFWDDPDKSQRFVKELKPLKDTIAEFKSLEDQYEYIETLIEMGYEENDPAIVDDIQEAMDTFVSEFETLRVSTLLSNEYDKNDAILTLHAGAGGTEACDWVSMLSRMYQRFADKKGFSVQLLDFLDGEEAGLKSITLQINGENAFGYLKSE